MNDKDIRWVYNSILKIKSVTVWPSNDIPGCFYMVIGFKNSSPLITDRMPDRELLQEAANIIKDLIK